MSLFILLVLVYPYKCPAEFDVLKGVNMCILHVPEVKLILINLLYSD